jgi:hypothetical protein
VAARNQVALADDDGGKGTDADHDSSALAANELALLISFPYSSEPTIAVMSRNKSCSGRLLPWKLSTMTRYI